MQFLIRKMTLEKGYKSQAFKFLSVVIRNSHRLQTFALAQLSGDSSFRHRIYLMKDTAKFKIDYIKELIRKRTIAAGHDGDQEYDESTMEEDIEKVAVHTSLIDFISVAAHKNAVGIQQVKRIVDIECLFDALLATSIPFVIKRSYLRLLLQGFIIPEGRECLSMNFTEPRFLKVMKYVVKLDIENYY
jgi:hypothetical protein